MTYATVLQDIPSVEKKTQEIFNTFDQDGSGEIDFKELGTFCVSVSGALGLPAPTKEQVFDVMKQYDGN